MDSLCNVSQSILAVHGVVSRAGRQSVGSVDQVAMSADDFLPLLTYVLIKAAPPNLLIVSEICAHLLDPEESIAERGYFVASLQAAVNISMNIQVEGFDLDQPTPDAPRIRKRDIFINKVNRLSFSTPTGDD